MYVFMSVFSGNDTVTTERLSKVTCSLINKTQYGLLCVIWFCQNPNVPKGIVFVLDFGSIPKSCMISENLFSLCLMNLSFYFKKTKITILSSVPTMSLLLEIHAFQYFSRNPQNLLIYL